MRITPILPKNNYHPAFGAIIYKSFNPQYNSQEIPLREEIDTFSKSMDNAEYLGSGLFADAYVFDIFPNIVIKKSNIGDDFGQEEENLKLIADEIKDTQKFVARAYDNTDGKYYLLSTKVDGESPDPEEAPLKYTHLKGLFSTLFEMDETGLYHGDLNNGNIKITPDGRVNFLDFQFTHQISRTRFFEEKDKSTLPAFMMIENAQMFEQAGLPYYLSKFDSKYQAKNFLKSYLTEKSNYHQKRFMLLSKETKNWPYSSEIPRIQKSLAYEKARAEVFKHPTENVLRLETKKIQFLNSFREAYKRIDDNVPHKNIIPAGSSYLFTLSCIQDFRKEVAAQQKQISNPAMKDYLDGMKEYGDFWFEKVKGWTDNAFWYPLRHAKNQLASWEHVRYNFKDPDVDIENFGVFTNVTGSVDDSYTPVYNRIFSPNPDVYDNYIKEAYPEAREFTGTNLSSEQEKILYKLRNAHQRLREAYFNSKGLDVINNAILTVLRASQLKEISSPYTYAYNTADAIMQKCSKAAEAYYKSIFRYITTDSINLQNSIGYDNMGRFA